MAHTATASNTRRMDYEALFSEAVHLAYAVFDAPTDEHVLGAFAVLVWHARHGIDLPVLRVH